MTFLTIIRQQAATQQMMQTRPKKTNPRSAPSRLHRQGFPGILVLGLVPSILVFLMMPAILDGRDLSAQTHARQTAEPMQQQKSTRPAQPGRADSETTAAQPPAAPSPVLPVNRPANPARVNWDNRGLEIEASNSSLNQILQQVAADTGARLEGLTQDQRVFGSYGPGPESDVLWKLLEDSGYNVLMIGGPDTHMPTKIILSNRSPASPQTTANNQNRSVPEPLEPEPQPDDPTEPSLPQPVQNPFGNGAPAKDPVKFMQEILQRQQQIDQQQRRQQDQQNNLEQ